MFEQVAQALKARGVRCFYDADEEIELWGKYLAEELPAIYGEQAAAVVIFVSAEYAARDWTRLERRAALARALRERREYVLPARFDDTPLPGLLPDVSYVDLRGRTPQQFAAMIAAKLAGLGISPSPGEAGKRPPGRPGSRGPSRQAMRLTGHTGWAVGWAEGTGLGPGNGGAHAVAFSPDGRLLASAGGDKTVRVWRAATGAPVHKLTGHKSGVSGVAFSPDGCLLASAGDDKTVRVWEAATGAPLRTLTGHAGWVLGVAFSGDGRLLASAAEDGTVRVWEAATGAPLRTLTGHADQVYGVVFSPDGSTLASAGNDHTVRVWEDATGSAVRVRTLTGHTGWVSAVAFSPDGRQVASGGSDGTVRVWEAATGAPLRTLTGHAGWVLGVAFNRDGSLIASAGRDKTGAAVGGGDRRRDRQAHRPHRPGECGGVQPGRVPARFGKPRQDSAAVGLNVTRDPQNPAAPRAWAPGTSPSGR